MRNIASNRTYSAGEPRPQRSVILAISEVLSESSDIGNRQSFAVGKAQQSEFPSEFWDLTISDLTSSLLLCLEFFCFQSRRTRGVRSSGQAGKNARFLQGFHGTGIEPHTRSFSDWGREGEEKGKIEKCQRAQRRFSLAPSVQKRDTPYSGC